MRPYRQGPDESDCEVELTDCSDCAHWRTCKRQNDLEQWVLHTKYFLNGEHHGTSFASACQYFDPSRLVRVARRLGLKKPKMFNTRRPIPEDPRGAQIWYPEGHGD